MATETEHERWMRLALEQARVAFDGGEVPVGCVIVREGRLLGRGWNRVESLNDPTAHAEILAISAAAATLGDQRLEGASVYVTVEPCLMCAGALVLARVEAVIYGADEPKFGAFGSRLRVQDIEGLNHRYRIQSGVLALESGAMLREFFRALRRNGRSAASMDLEGQDGPGSPWPSPPRRSDSSPNEFEAP